MKKYSLLCYSLLMMLMAFSQSPVTWKYNAVKIKEGIYELHFTASIESGWHIYSQTQPADAIAEPTAIALSKNPLLNISKETRELGTLEKYRSPSLNIEAWQYSGEVDFVKTVTLKAKAKTNVKGTISYQACTDKKCQALKSVPFVVQLE